MTEYQRVYLVASNGDTLAELVITDQEEGWFTGSVDSQNFPPEVEKALAWYDEVAREQMLSYLDEAIAAVQELKLRVVFPDGLTHKTYSLHVSQSNEVSFRISPVPPPPKLPSGII